MILSNGYSSINVSIVDMYILLNSLLDSTDKLLMWLPSLETIIISYCGESTDGTIIKFKDDDTELNLGLTGIEYALESYIRNEQRHAIEKDIGDCKYKMCCNKDQAVYILEFIQRNYKNMMTKLVLKNI